MFNLKGNSCTGSGSGKSFVPKDAYFAKFDLSVVGFHGGNQEFRAAASATRVRAQEPVNFAGTFTSGVASVNTVVALTDAKPVIGTDNFVGVSAQDWAVDSAGTVTAQKVQVTIPIAHATRIRGLAKTKANIDTDSELLGVLWDSVLFDLTSSQYTIDETAAADTSGLTVRGGSTSKGTLDVVVDARAMRADVS